MHETNPIVSEIAQYKLGRMIGVVISLCSGAGVCGCDCVWLVSGCVDLCICVCVYVCENRVCVSKCQVVCVIRMCVDICVYGA